MLRRTLRILPFEATQFPRQPRYRTFCMRSAHLFSCNNENHTKHLNIKYATMCLVCDRRVLSVATVKTTWNTWMSNKLLRVACLIGELDLYFCSNDENHTKNLNIKVCDRTAVCSSRKTCVPGGYNDLKIWSANSMIQTFPGPFSPVSKPIFAM